MQEEISPGVWQDYIGPNVVLDSDLNTVTISSDPSELALHGTSLSIRIVGASIDSLVDAISPVYWYLTVEFMDPCSQGNFEDHAGIASPIEAVIRDSPHPSPIIQDIPAFPIFYKGLELTNCGAQTISLVDQILNEGVLADFVEVSS